MPAFLSRLLFDPSLRSARIKTVFLLCSAMILAGAIPGARAEMDKYASDVILHGLTYAGLTLLWFFGSTGSGTVRATKAVLAIALIGAGDELVQSLMPYRSAEFGDWMVDVIAALLTSTLLAWMVRRHGAVR